MRIIDKIFRDKKGNSVIYIILAVGILMLVSANSFFTAKPAPETSASINFSKTQEAEQILSKINGVGEVSIMISYETENDEGEKREICGVLVVAEGAKNTGVKEKIVSAAQAALGVEPHKIRVFERKE